MRNIKLTIEFEGTNYCGWQVQKNGISIQSVLQQAIESIVKHEIRLTGSSRTDAGVHARGMAVNFQTSSSIPCTNFPAAINSKLPYDIAVVCAEDMPPDFHSRYSSTGKKYSYTILNRKAPSPIDRRFSAHVSTLLDVGKMQQAAAHFLGTHDFSAFKSSGSSVVNNIRTVSLLNVNKNGNIIKIEIQADGFLYNMVRIIAGTLIDVGRGKIRPEDIIPLIESGRRDHAGKTAPACGLCLEYVFY